MSKAMGRVAKMGIILLGAIALLPAWSQTKDHVIGIGETVQIFVWGTEEDLSRQVTVRQNGSILLPWIGELQAAGKTYRELEEVVRAGLARFFKNFGVAVAPAESKPSVSALGAVQKIGPMDYFPGMTAADAIAAAGGLSASAVGTVRIISKNGEVKDIDFNALLEEKEIGKNLLLQNGDILYALPKKGKEKISVTVIGRVAKQGPVELPANSDIFTAIVAAGGVIGEAVQAAGGAIHFGSRYGAYNIQVRRKDKVVRTGLLDASTMKLTEFEPGDTTGHMTLQDGDLVMVVTMRQVVAVLGEVQAPGVYELDPGMRVSDLIVLAGGFADNPYLKRSGIIREEGQKGKWIDLNLEEVFRKGQFRTNYELKPKDIVFVPNRTRRLTIRSILGTLGQIFFPAQAINELLRAIGNRR